MVVVHTVLLLHDWFVPLVPLAPLLRLVLSGALLRLPDELVNRCREPLELRSPLPTGSKALGLATAAAAALICAARFVPSKPPTALALPVEALGSR